MLIVTNDIANAESAQSQDFFVGQLLAQAKELKLAKEPAWLNLLHYKTGFSGKQQSQADDASFFLSPFGQNNAEAELRSDISAFFGVSAEYSASQSQCRFPARLHWLSTKLDFFDRLPAVNCEAYDAWKRHLNAQQVTLLFPSMHLDNPASMFGHTFIRFDKLGSQSLLSKTLSYAAATDKNDPGLVYAWKGITGGYNGQFYIKAYFETLQEYSDIEQRDIWEYSLNLTPQEVEQLVRHLWEVQGIKFDYYFLRENCAFRLLALLDVARENLNMSTNSHPVYAIPVDTVRDIEHAGLIQHRFYRPATHNKISKMAASLPQANVDVAISLTNGETSIDDISARFSEKEQARIYLFADEMLSLDKKLTEGQQALQFEILSARSKLSVKPEEVAFKLSGEPPEISHQSARWQISAGEYDRQAFYEIGIRPAFHDLLDTSQGFINGAAISVLDTQLRWYEEKDKLVVEKINLFSIRSLVPLKPWSDGLSRQVSLQVKKRNKNVDQKIRELNAQFDIGYSMGTKNILAYLMAKTQLEYATELNDNHVFYLGAEAGFIWNIKSDFLSAQTEIVYRNLQHISGEQGDVQSVRAGVQLNVSKEQALRFGYEYTSYENFDVQQARLSYLYYF